MEVVPASVVVQPIIVKSYDEMSLDELIYAVNFYQLPMKYSEPYTYSTARLTKRRGVVYYNGHKETYYSEKKIRNVRNVRIIVIIVNQMRNV